MVVWCTREGKLPFALRITAVTSITTDLSPESATIWIVGRCYRPANAGATLNPLNPRTTLRYHRMLVLREIFDDHIAVIPFGPAGWHVSAIVSIWPYAIDSKPHWLLVSSAVWKPPISAATVDHSAVFRV